MRKSGLTMKATMAAAAVGVGVLSLAAPAEAAPAASSEGCPSGYVCIYPGASWNGGSPSLKFYTYGYHNLSNVVGTHRFFNNQTGGASAYACSGYNGTGSDLFGVTTGWADENFTPANSVVLDASGNFPKNC
ncbi:MAG TPA: hypothetical protein VMB79_06055 [Jatrophihabitans sp.]|nr:hypothetical protein [Jatrophihabitans sp.]